MTMTMTMKYWMLYVYASAVVLFLFSGSATGQATCSCSPSTYTLTIDFSDPCTEVGKVDCKCISGRGGRACCLPCCTSREQEEHNQCSQAALVSSAHHLCDDCVPFDLSYCCFKYDRKIVRIRKKRKTIVVVKPRMTLKFLPNPNRRSCKGIPIQLVRFWSYCIRMWCHNPRYFLVSWWYNPDTELGVRRERNQDFQVRIHKLYIRYIYPTPHYSARLSKPVHHPSTPMHQHRPCIYTRMLPLVFLRYYIGFPYHKKRRLLEQIHLLPCRFH